MKKLIPGSHPKYGKSDFTNRMTMLLARAGRRVFVAVDDPQRRASYKQYFQEAGLVVEEQEGGLSVHK